VCAVQARYNATQRNTTHAVNMRGIGEAVQATAVPLQLHPQTAETTSTTAATSHLTPQQVPSNDTATAHISGASCRQV
jgi:hypothetical protein